MKQKKDILIIISLLVIAGFMWIRYGIAGIITSQATPAYFNEKVSPINPEIDTKAIDKLKTREQITPVLELEDVCVECNITPVASPSAPQTASQEGALQP